MRLLFICFFIASHCHLNSGYKILGIFPSHSKSHFIVGSALMKGLADRGHEVSVISPHPQETPYKNYRDIYVPGIHQVIKDTTIPISQWANFSIIELGRQCNIVSFHISNHTLKHEAVQRLINDPNEHFDLIFFEVFMNQAMLGFGHHFKAPLIGLSTFTANKWTNDMVGTHLPSSFVPDAMLPFTNKMNFVERLINVIMTTSWVVYHNIWYMPIQNKIYEEIFPNPKPPLNELVKNVSLVFLNTHFTLNYPNPYVPNMIEVGGIQLYEMKKSLPTDIKAFLDGAVDGALYFSMGTNVKTTELSPKFTEDIFAVFSKLKQRVLCKIDDNQLTNVPKNIMIRKWFPQDQVLAHANVKAFITHGGLLGLTEAIFYSKPVIGIPVFADQPLNIAKAARYGYGIPLPLDELNQETLSAAINEILTNTSYVENIKSLSQRYKDQPLNPMETAIFWVEYVIRHKGAPHLRSGAQDLNAFQYYSLDVYGFLIGVLVTVLILVKIIVKFLVRSVKSMFQSKPKVKKS